MDRSTAPRHRLARLAALVAAGATLAGCFTGERPSFEDEDSSPVVSTGNPDIDLVLGLLDSVDRSEFTAGYQIETRFNSVSSTGLVVQSQGRRRSVTIENADRHVRFIIDGDDRRTCDLLEETCEVGLNDARISDTQLPHEFYGPAFANRLRVDAARRIGDAEAYTKTVAGQPAECVDIAVSGGSIESLKNALAVRFGHPRSPVADRDAGPPPL